MRKYSIIIPVYNRPEEVDELLQSLTQQNLSPYEVLVIDDGSTRSSEEVAEKYKDELNIRYFSKVNTGQGYTRNYGFERAEGDYFIVFDSDCIIPDEYLANVHLALEENYLDAFGGPDKAHNSFTITQKAISYSMTSVFTTGGIRGRKKHAGKFHPRSFNMGISREVFEKTEGFLLTRMGEDIEFSIRVLENGFKSGLIPDAYVYHKRRTNLLDFWKQLHFFGRARVNINRFCPGELKVVHLFPLFFFLGLIFLAISPLIHPVIFQVVGLGYAFYFLMIALGSMVKNGPLVGVLSVLTSLIQLSAYATGMIRESFV